MCCSVDFRHWDNFTDAVADISAQTNHGITELIFGPVWFTMPLLEAGVDLCMTIEVCDVPAIFVPLPLEDMLSLTASRKRTSRN